MTNLANAAIAASLLVSMVSIPAASQSIGSSNSIQPALDNISSSKEIPREESTSIDSDSFIRKTESAFSSFRTKVTSGEVSGRLENPHTSLRVESEPGETRWILESPEGRLEVSDTADSTTRKVTTPYGTLVRKSKDGGISRSFEGSNREKVEKIMEDLLKKLEQRQQKYRKKAKKSRLKYYRDGFSLEVVSGGNDNPEKVVITNSMSRKVDLSGWKVTNDNPDSFELNTSIGAGESLHLYTEEESSEEVENVTEGDGIYVYGSGLSWDDTGDTATLYDSSGGRIARKSY
ncbi:MAG: lamin tail domain-containing protein [Candidatus Nanohaloarchaea archaeon]